MKKPGKSSQKLVITDQMLHTHIAQTAPMISTWTGWDLRLDAFGCRVLPRDHGYEEILPGRLNQVGYWQGNSRNPSSDDGRVSPSI